MKKKLLHTFILILALVNTNQLLIAQKGYDSKRKIKLDKLQEDYRILREIIEAVHPGLYLYQTPEKMTKTFDDYYLKINRDLTELEFYKLIVPMLDSIHCGHTSAELSPEYYNKLYSKPLIPFDIEIIDNKFFVKKNWIDSLDLLPGTEILTINGFTAKEIIDSISPSISCDSYQRAYKLFRMALHFRLHFAKYFDQTEKFELSITQPKDSIQEQLVVSGIGWKELQRKDTLPTPKPLSYEIIDSISTCVLRIESFSMGYIGLFGIDYKVFFKDVFTQICRKNIQNLVIDIRGNDGGNPEVFITLLKYLMYKSFNVYSKSVIQTQVYPKVFFKYSDLPRKYSKKWISSFTESINGEIVVKPTDKFIETLIQQPEDTIFRGNLYILTDAGSYSAASVLPSFLKSNQKVTLFGEETGGTASGNTGGIIPTVNLPKSKIRINVPLASTVINSNNLIWGRGVTPHFSIQRKPEDIIDNRDRQMEYLMNYIRFSKDSLPDNYFEIKLKKEGSSINGESQYIEGFRFSINIPDEYKTKGLDNDQFIKLVDDKKITGILTSPNQKITPLQFEIVNHRGFDDIYMKTSLGYFLWEKFEIKNDTLSFVINWWYCSPATQKDLQILQMAKSLLLDSTDWNSNDDRKCEDDIECNKWSLFCALRNSSIQVTGEYNHHNTAMQTVRNIIFELNPEIEFEHALMDCNNSENTNFSDIIRILDIAVNKIKQQLAEKE